MVLDVLFGRKPKTHQEEAQLLLEELRWGLDHERVEVEQERRKRLDDSFNRFWKIHVESALAAIESLELPDLLLEGAPDDKEQRVAFLIEQRRLILREAWLREGGRCALTHRDRPLAFELVPGVRAPKPKGKSGKNKDAPRKGKETAAQAMARQRREDRQKVLERNQLRQELAASVRLVSRSR